MNRAALLYGLSLAAMTAFHFGHRVVEHYAEKTHCKMLRNVFNTRIQSIASEEEKMYYLLARKIVLYNRYFGHLDLVNLITVCNKENYDIMHREWVCLKTSPRDLFLVFSIPYNMGIFMPVFLPIAIHILKAVRAQWRRSRDRLAAFALPCGTL
eukprot:jgi/Antlo1/2243/1854